MAADLASQGGADVAGLMYQQQQIYHALTSREGVHNSPAVQSMSCLVFEASVWVCRPIPNIVYKVNTLRYAVGPG